MNSCLQRWFQELLTGKCHETWGKAIAKANQAHRQDSLPCPREKCVLLNLEGNKTLHLQHLSSVSQVKPMWQLGLVHSLVRNSAGATGCWD